MAIVLDASGGTASTGSSNASWSHTVAAGSYRIGIAGVAHNVQTEDITSMTWGGVDMTLIASTSVSNVEGSLYYITSPAVGVSSVNVQTGAAVRIGAISATFTGVEISDPIGTAETATVSPSTSVADTVTTEVGWMAVDFVAVIADLENQYAVDGSQVEIDKQFVNEGTEANNAFAGMSYEVATGPSVEMLWGLDTKTACMITVPLKTASIGKVRAVKYFHDINDPGGRIIDDTGRIVPPWEVRPNNWIRVTGLFLPTTTIYESFAHDPELAYIEEVGYSIRGGLRIKTNRGELTEVLLARAAGGKSL